MQDDQRNEKPKIRLGDDGELLEDSLPPSYKNTSGKRKQQPPRWVHNLESCLIALLLLILGLLGGVGISRLVQPTPMAANITPVPTVLDTKTSLPVTGAISVTVTLTPLTIASDTPYPTRTATKILPSATPSPLPIAPPTAGFTPFAPLETLAISPTPFSSTSFCSNVLTNQADMIAISTFGTGESASVYLRDMSNGSGCSPFYGLFAVGPVWSPNGRYIAFEGHADINHAQDLFVFDAQSASVRQLTTTEGNVRPAWSPDSQTIAYVALTDPQSGIHLINVDGSNDRFIVPADVAGRIYWSSDGKQLTFFAEMGDVALPANSIGSVPEIYVTDLDGSNLKRLTNNQAPDFVDGWSPDGKQLLFESQREGFRAVYMMNADGTDVRRLTGPEGDSYFPVLSPDGKRIAFISKRDGSIQLYRMNADGSDQRQLTTAVADDYYPVWSPDGTRIIYVQAINNGKVLVLINADGSNPQRVSDVNNISYFVSWRGPIR